MYEKTPHLTGKNIDMHEKYLKNVTTKFEINYPTSPHGESGRIKICGTNKEMVARAAEMIFNQDKYCVNNNNSSRSFNNSKRERIHTHIPSTAYIKKATAINKRFGEEVWIEVDNQKIESFRVMQKKELEGMEIESNEQKNEKLRNELSCTSRTKLKGLIEDNPKNIELKDRTLSAKTIKEIKIIIAENGGWQASFGWEGTDYWIKAIDDVVAKKSPSTNLANNDGLRKAVVRIISKKSTAV